MANIITTLSLEMSANWYVTKKLNSIGRVGENTVTKLIIEPTEILDGVTYEIEIADASGSKNVAELTVEDSELYLILTANMLTTSGITKMQVRGLFEDGSIKKSNIFELKVNRSISATEHYEEYAVTIFDQLVQDCRDIIEGAESYAVRAETAAVNAEAYSESASASAEAASTASETAQTASVTAVNAATSAQTAAETAANTASTAASNASASATSASTSASNAATSETNASASATNAAASAESIAASVAQINENTYRINDLEAIIAGYTLTDLPTGAIASITDGTALLMPSLKIGIEPVQEGSGNPSPDNIRPISGWTAANIAVSPTTSAEDGTTYTIQFRDGDNPLTVYGGTLNVTTGELVVDRAYKEFDGTENWTIYVTSEINTVFILYSIIPNANIPLRPKSSQFNYNSQAFEIASGREYTYHLETSGSHRLFMQIPTSVASTNEAFKTWLATQKANDTPVAILVKITPQSIQLTPTQIRTLVGNNNIWADTGNIIEGKYFKSLS